MSGTVRFLHEADSGDKIWAEVDEATTFLAGKLLGSFGSGSFMDGKDATKTMDSWIEFYSAPVRCLRPCLGLRYCRVGVSDSEYA